MRRSLLAAGLALSAVSACGGGGGTSSPIGSRDPAPSGVDQAPGGTDSPPATAETPPASTDPGGSGAEGLAACVHCSGSFSCVAQGTGTTATITLGVKDGVCEADGTPIPSCDAAAPSGATALVSFTVSGGGFTACTVVNSAQVCAVCTRVSSSSSPGSGTGTTVTVSGGTNCSSLSTCCGKLPAANQASCDTIVSSNVDVACGDLLTQLQGIGQCK